MNEYAHIEQDDLFSDEMVGKISTLVVHLKNEMKEQGNPQEPDAQDIIRKKVSDFVAAENIKKMTFGYSFKKVLYLLKNIVNVV